VIIDPVFLKLLVKYENDPGCVLDSDGSDSAFNSEDKRLEFSLAIKTGYNGSRSVLVSSLKRNLPMISSSLEYVKSKLIYI
jgi:hypothetical protein